MSIESGVTRSGRREAEQVVRRAADIGRLSIVDRDLRLAAIECAGSPQEIDLLVRDLPTTDPEAVTYAPYEPGRSHRDTPAAGPVATRRRSAWRLAPRMLGLVVVGAVAAAAVIGQARSEGGSEAPGSGSETDVLTAAGYRSMLTDLRAERGSTEVYVAFLTSDAAFLTVPVAGGGAEQWRWDGDLEESGGSGAPGTDPFDLATIRPRTVHSLVEQVRTMLDVPEATVSVTVVDVGVLDMPLLVSGTDDDGRSATVGARADGSVVTRSQS